MEGNRETFDYDKLLVSYEEKLKWRKSPGCPQGGAPTGWPPPPTPQPTGQHRPANLYNGVLTPIISYGIKGAIWYQGESNGRRGHAYREVFPDDSILERCLKQGDFLFTGFSWRILW